MSRVERDWMTARVGALRAAVAGELEGVRSPRPDDLEAFARLMLDAYRGTVDDGGETIVEARSEAAKTLEGGYGAVDWEASCVVEREAELVAATIVVRDASKWRTGEAFVAFSLTTPAWQRKGLARAGLERALGVLSRRGEERVHLVVTRANERAVALYRSMGFVRVELRPTSESQA